MPTVKPLTGASLPADFPHDLTKNLTAYLAYYLYAILPCLLTVRKSIGVFAGAFFFCISFAFRRTILWEGRDAKCKRKSKRSSPTASM